MLLMFISFLLLARSWLGASGNVRAIPAIGPSAPLLSYVGAFRLLFDSQSIFQEGYRKYRNGLFRIADFGSWTIIVSGPKHIEDIRKAPEDVLTIETAIDEALHALEPRIRRSQFHIPIVQNQLTRELNDSFADLRDEVDIAFSEKIVLPSEEWQRFGALDMTLEVVSRVAHRLFVGLPLCRESDYQSLNTMFAMDISKAASVIRLFPPFLQRFVGLPFANVTLSMKRIIFFIRPLVEERWRNIQLYGRNYPGKPEDLLSWFMAEVDGDTDEMKLEHIAFHLLMLNFGSVYTTTTSFTQALFHLAAHTEYIEPLREEMEAVILEEGWTKQAMGGMNKLDSFLKESQRLSGLSAAAAYRRVLKPFTFSDGTCVPVGARIAIAAHSTHLDEAIYPEAKTFQGFRFVTMDKGPSSQMVTASQDYLPFGVGRHMCPGRFFTVVVMKVMMTHVLMNYDIKLGKGEQPTESWFVTENLANGSAAVLFRKRKDKIS
ncbi:cytochrome P450 [Phlegmacium glaucopus]|nr:cytochrome P450 [Phlegmacium glaucopus]